MTSRGFTLTELVVIVTILGVLSWIAYPKMVAMDEIKLDAAARRLAGDLRYAQTLAMSRRVVHGILFNAAQEKYTVFAPNAATPVTDPADRARTLIVDYTSRTEFKGVQVTTAAFGTTPGVTFDYYGVPRDTAGVDLTSDGVVVLSYQGNSDSILVAPQTGTVTVR
ncbi:MAG TPA: GspH/FimT family pseudopilin [Candidatus Polarisedimenticolia bacterium]|nr:GspH/FimT family pseudopilin [Candidatus Polarisedimenticolia bacterium]